MAELEVRLLDLHEFDSWNRFVEFSPQGTLYHTSDWLHAIASAYVPARPLIIGCFDNHQLVGGGVFLERERYGILTAVTPLLTPYFGFVLEEPGGEKFSATASKNHAVLSALGQYLCKHYAYVNLVLAPHLEDIRPLQQLGFTITPRFTYCLNLRLSPEEHWGRFDGSARRQIKKAQKESFEICSRLPIAPAYRLFESTFRRRGEDCPVSESLFSAVLENHGLADRRAIFAAWLGDSLASYIVLLTFNRTLYYAIAASEADYLSSGINSLLIWEIIREYAGRDWNIFDFVGANTPSIARFKENFNPRLQLYFQVEYYGLAALKIGRDIMALLRGEARPK